MSDSAVSSSISKTASRSRRGQSFVEFALILPLLMVLLLGIADFGRVFAAGITLEAAARNGAEAAAQEYVQLQRNDAAPLTTAEYDAIRAVAHEVACEEASRLENRAGSGSTCTSPVTAVCIHDDEAPGDATGCGNSSGAVPAECWALVETWDYQDKIGTTDLPYVEVRICYRFTTMFNLTELSLPLNQGLSLGEIWLQRDRSFVAGDY